MNIKVWDNMSDLDKERVIHKGILRLLKQEVYKPERTELGYILARRISDIEF